jgi:hypothetical protein
MFIGLVNRDWLPVIIRCAHKTSQFELNVEFTAGCKYRLFGCSGWVGKDLAIRSAYRCPGDDDRGGSAVIADWKVLVVGLEGVGGVAKEAACVEGVIHACEEVL